MQRVFRWLVSAGSIATLLAVLLGYFGPIVFELDMFAHFRLHLLILCGPLALMAGVMRAGAAFWRTLVAGVLAFAGLAPLWHHPLPPGGDVEIVVAAANLYRHNDEPVAMKRALLDIDADVLVTVETTKTTLTGPGSLALKYPYRLSLVTSGQILRAVIWSKFPMHDGQLLLEDQVEPTGAHAIVRVPGAMDVAILGVHLAHNLFGNQKQQVDALGRIVAGLPRPLIIMGDFNATAWSHAVRHIEALTTTQRVGGFAITWQGAYPTSLGKIKAPMGLQIDHTLVSPQIGVRSVDWFDLPGSDHRAVVATLQLPASG